MNNITFAEYRKEIYSLALALVGDAIDALQYDGYEVISRDDVEDRIIGTDYLTMDSLLHEAIDGHQWIIYYAYNDDVLRYTEHSDAYQDCYSNEDLGQLVAEKGFDSAKAMMAYFAMYNDVLDHLDEAIENKF